MGGMGLERLFSPWDLGPAYLSLANKWSGARPHRDPPIYPPLERTCWDRESVRIIISFTAGDREWKRAIFFLALALSVGKWCWYKTPVDGFIVQSWSTFHVTSACTHFPQRALFLRKPRFGHIRRESSLCVRRFFAMYATQEFYSFP